MASGSVAKRKRPQAAAERPPKRARSENRDESDDDQQAQILLLENGIVESKKNYNNIAALLTYAQKDDDEDGTDLVASVSLCRVFIRLLAQGALRRKKGGSEKDAVVVTWLKDRLSEYKAVLQRLMLQEDASSTALTLAMRLLKAEAAATSSESEEYSFPRQFMTQIVAAAVSKGAGAGELRAELAENFVNVYDDVRFYTFKGISETLAAQSPDAPPSFDAVLELLVSVEAVPESNDDIGEFYLDPPKKKSHSMYSVAQHKRPAQDAWVKLLNLGLDKEQRKRVLAVISTHVAPWFTKPEMLMDFLTDSFNEGGSVSLLALSGVFYLIQERNLDYPEFYNKLYSLLDADLLHSKHRSRFFRLLDTFLSSSHLPAQLVASFIKRLARLCLNAPPSAIVVVVPWFYNLFKKHPLCTFMMHHEVRTDEERELLENGGMDDPFLPDEKDPMETQAIESCLWEIVQLQSHYHPNVATIAKIISEQFTKQFYNVEDFLDHSYASLLDGELSKEIKRSPVVEFQIPKRVLLPHDRESGQQDSLLVKLWDFQ
ncbi:nucleolar complex protein 4 [Gaeumannomyces tritici R3-111a-1]|uniref:Nucleolar complex protein 4 n=1 Tax=Gaeumannomyces tritici (strain R3-111a-1) TaxID=644352 RepID=J3NL31_GAET3|nr:nucleolar complex protein 4 [Gaeumannomyces tritici R3-111a-1]EJT81998.1 nucleolar complex protein 4 [Gaeumannomyces tritici R3-111a-1]